MTKYLIVGPSWVGDMVMAQSLFMSIKQREPDAVIDVVGPAWSTPVLQRMPQVRQAIVLDSQHGRWNFSLRRKLGKSLIKESYDKAIVLPRSWKSALVPFFAKIPYRVGFHGEQRYFLLNNRRKLDKAILNQTVKRFISLGLPLEEAYKDFAIPYPQLMVDQANLARVKIAFSLDDSRPVIAMMPGAEYGPAKQWPLQYFREAAKACLDKNYQVWILGGPKDIVAGEEIIKGLNKFAINLCGKTQLEDVVDLFFAATHVITNDSGLMHVAAAVGVKVHSIYGSTSEQFTPALTDKKTEYSLHLSCSPCFKRECPLEHANCLNELKPAMILKNI